MRGALGRVYGWVPPAPAGPVYLSQLGGTYSANAASSTTNKKFSIPSSEPLRQEYGINQIIIKSNFFRITFLTAELRAAFWPKVLACRINGEEFSFELFNNQSGKNIQSGDLDVVAASASVFDTDTITFEVLA